MACQFSEGQGRGSTWRVVFHPDDMVGLGGGGIIVKAVVSQIWDAQYAADPLFGSHSPQERASFLVEAVAEQPALQPNCGVPCVTRCRPAGSRPAAEDDLVVERQEPDLYHTVQDESY